MPTAPATPTLPQVSFVNLYSEDPWKKRQRVRIQQACSECRRQKIKCDGQKPCKSCKKSDRSCIYNASAGSKDDHDHHSSSAHDDHAPATTTTTTTNSSRGSSEVNSAAVSTSSSADASHASSPAHPHSPHPYSKPHQNQHQHVVHRVHHHAHHVHHNTPKDSHAPYIKQEPSDVVKPSPLRRDSKHNHKSHDHHADTKTKIQVKDIGKYGIPLDEWQKQDDSNLHHARKT
ncbi:hypothetical protein BGX23_008874, partial [Mortierella sp. AD031]